MIPKLLHLSLVVTEQVRRALNNCPVSDVVGALVWCEIPIVNQSWHCYCCYCCLRTTDVASWVGNDSVTALEASAYVIVVEKMRPGLREPQA